MRQFLHFFGRDAPHSNGFSNGWVEAALLPWAYDANEEMTEKDDAIAKNWIHIFVPFEFRYVCLWETSISIIYAKSSKCSKELKQVDFGPRNMLRRSR